MIADSEAVITVEKTSKDQGKGVLTVEHAAYAAIGLLAAGLRLFQLGLRPLNEAEATQALAAFRFVTGAAQAAPTGTIPALFTGNVVGFWLLGNSDATARWLPALAGLVLVLLPYGLRHRLGRGGALAASLYLALSPSAIFVSRTADGASLVAACGLALVVGLIDYLDVRRSGFLYLAAVALGLGLCAGPGIYTLLLILLACGSVLYLGERFLRRDLGWSSLREAWGVARDERGLLARVGALLAGTFGLVSTTLVLHPAGAGYAADLIGAWYKGFWPGTGSQPVVYPLLLLLRYEPLLLLLGLVEAGRSIRLPKSPIQTLPSRSSFPHTLLFAFWAVAAGLFMLVPGQRSAGNVLLVVIPLALLSGEGTERAWRWLTRRGLWPGAGLGSGIAMGLLVFFYLQLTAYSQASSTTVMTIGGLTLNTASTYLLLGSVALLLLVGLGAAAWFWRGPDLVVAGGWLTMLIALGLFGFKSAWGVNFAHASDPRELMIVQTTSPDVRLLVEQMEKLSLDKSGDTHTLEIAIDAATGPVVAWYLREFDHQTVMQGLTDPPDTMAAVTLAVQDLPIGEVFRGRGFPLRDQWLPWELGGQKLVRWLLFTEGSLPTVEQEVVLWVTSQSQ